MESLVLELQRDCFDSRVSALEVLRKAAVVARKLGLSDAQLWIEKELDGFRKGDPPPPYRLLNGLVKSWNPYVGWIPVVFEDSREAEALSKCYVAQPIGELEDLLRHGDGVIEVPFDPKTEQRMMEESEMPLHTTRHLSRASISGIIDAVRNMVLNWTLKLEEDGILGAGMTFTPKEKAIAAEAQYTIHYHAPVGNSQIQQGSPGGAQTMKVREPDLSGLREIIAELRSHAAEFKLERPDADQFRADIDAVESQLSSPRPNKVVLRELIGSITNMIEGCTGNILATGLLHRLQGL